MSIYDAQADTCTHGYGPGMPVGDTECPYGCTFTRDGVLIVDIDNGCAYVGTADGYGYGYDHAATNKLCRDCHGWGTLTTTYPGGLMSTGDCRRCAGTGEEIW